MGGTCTGRRLHARMDCFLLPNHGAITMRFELRVNWNSSIGWAVTDLGCTQRDQPLEKSRERLGNARRASVARKFSGMRHRATAAGGRRHAATAARHNVVAVFRLRDTTSVDVFMPRYAGRQSRQWGIHSD